MRKTNILHMQNKDADQLCSTAKLINAFVFATQIGQFHYFLNLKFPVSSHLLFLYSSVCVGPVWKQHCWFSHVAAQMFSKYSFLQNSKLIFFKILKHVQRQLMENNFVRLI